MSLIRAWYRYNETVPGGNLNPNNYFHVGSLPEGECRPYGNQICIVYGIYDDGIFTYGDHPKPFSPRLESYINAAFSNNTFFPNSGIEKPYVYVKVV